MELPGEVLANVFAHLPAATRRTVVSAVCKDWQAVVCDPALWVSATVDLREELLSASSPTAPLQWHAVAAWLTRRAPHAERLHLSLGGDAPAAAAAAHAGADAPGAAAAISALRASLRALVAEGPHLPPLRAMLPALAGCAHLRVLQLHQLPGGFWPLAQVEALAALPALDHLTASATNLFLHNYGPLAARTPRLRGLDVTLGDAAAAPASRRVGLPLMAAPAAAGGPAQAQSPPPPPPQQQQQQEPMRQEGCSPDDLVMAGVLHMVTSMASMLFAVLDSYLLLQQPPPGDLGAGLPVAPPAAPAPPAVGASAGCGCRCAGAGAPPGGQPPLELVGGGSSGTLRITCHGSAGAHLEQVAIVTTAHLGLVYARPTAAAAAAAAAAGRPTPRHSGGADGERREGVCRCSEDGGGAASAASWCRCRRRRGEGGGDGAGGDAGGAPCAAARPSVLRLLASYVNVDSAQRAFGLLAA